jgi:GR25 family glycosyltransferase involved in LPS biosynthesis
MADVFRRLEIDFTTISQFDRDDISLKVDDSSRWDQHVADIQHILVANTLAGHHSSYEDALSAAECINERPLWMAARALRPGEISVLLKHYQAHLLIATGNSDYGLIFEDDIVLRDGSEYLFRQHIDEFVRLRGNYLDIAGGAGLVVDRVRDHCYISSIYPARTRTNACYCISKSAASQFVTNFMPLALPIDWHLQYLMHKTRLSGCFWSIEHPVIHGSEAGLISSWRTEHV